MASVDLCPRVLQVFIAAIIGQTKVLASALRTFQEFENGSKVN